MQTSSILSETLLSVLLIEVTRKLLLYDNFKLSSFTFFGIRFKKLQERATFGDD